MIKKQEIAAVKKKIEQYYYNEKVIVWKNEKLERLTKRLEELDELRKNGTFSLKKELEAIRYDGIKVQGGKLPQSPMENQIDILYDKVERRYEQTYHELVQLKIQIEELEDKQKETEFYIRMLNEENKKLLQYKHEEKLRTTQIAFLMHLSKSTVCRNLYEIYEWLYKIMDYNGVFEKNVKQNETILQQNETKTKQNETKLRLFL